MPDAPGPGPIGATRPGEGVATEPLLDDEGNPLPADGDPNAGDELASDLSAESGDSRSQYSRRARRAGRGRGGPRLLRRDQRRHFARAFGCGPTAAHRPANRRSSSPTASPRPAAFGGIHDARPHRCRSRLALRRCPGRADATGATAPCNASSAPTRCAARSSMAPRRSSARGGSHRPTCAKCGRKPRARCPRPQYTSARPRLCAHRARHQRLPGPVGVRRPARGNAGRGPARGRVVAVTNAECRAEWLRVLDYPRLQLDEDRRAGLVQAFDSLAQLLPDAAPAREPALLPRCADPDDQKFLQLASIRARAGWSAATATCWRWAGAPPRWPVRDRARRRPGRPCRLTRAPVRPRDQISKRYDSFTSNCSLSRRSNASMNSLLRIEATAMSSSNNEPPRT